VLPWAVAARMGVQDLGDVRVGPRNAGDGHGGAA
jgi:hypothetical protein